MSGDLIISDWVSNMHPEDILRPHHEIEKLVIFSKMCKTRRGKAKHVKLSDQELLGHEDEVQNK